MDNKILTYKGHHGSVEFELESGTIYGKLQFINDLVTYEAETIAALRKEFEEAVDDYLATCAELGKEPDKPCSGTLNVRLGPERHKKVAVAALTKGTTINQELNRAVDAYLAEPRPEVHYHYHAAKSQEVEIGGDWPEINVLQTATERH